MTTPTDPARDDAPTAAPSEAPIEEQPCPIRTTPPPTPNLT